MTEKGQLIIELMDILGGEVITAKNIHLIFGENFVFYPNDNYICTNKKTKMKEEEIEEKIVITLAKACFTAAACGAFGGFKRENMPALLLDGDGYDCLEKLSKSTEIIGFPIEKEQKAAFWSEARDIYPKESDKEKAVAYSKDAILISWLNQHGKNNFWGLLTPKFFL